MRATDLVVRTVTVGGPLPLFGAAASAVIIAVSAIEPSKHADLIVALGCGIFVLSFAEWAIARRMAAAEYSQHATFSVMLEATIKPLKDRVDTMIAVFDGHAASYDAVAREVRNLRTSVDKLDDRVNVAEAALLVRK